MNVTLGQRIRQTRRALLISVTELAKKVDVTPAAISDIEHSRRMPKRDLMEKIAKTLNIPIEELEVLDGRIDDDLRIEAEKVPEIAFLLRTIVKSDDPKKLAKKFLNEAEKRT